MSRKYVRLGHNFEASYPKATVREDMFLQALCSIKRLKGHKEKT